MSPERSYAATERDIKGEPPQDMQKLLIHCSIKLSTMPQVENNKGVTSRKDYAMSTKKAGKNYLLVIGIDE